jgi:hypothetical protein
VGVRYEWAAPLGGTQWKISDTLDVLKGIPAYMKEDPPDLLSTFDLASTSQRNELQALQRSGLFRRPPSWDRLSRLCPIWRLLIIDH